ncbi:MAG: radical SAM protein [Acetatifactor sp.]
MMQVIIYGAGKNAYKLWGDTDKTSKEMQEIFSNAVAFVDSDSNKIGSNYMGLPVMQLNDAVKKYPNAYVYISVWFSEEIYSEILNDLLLAGVDGKKIINCRKTCDYLEKFLVCGYHEGAFGGKAGCDIGDHSLKPCCSDYGKNQVDYVPIINNNLEQAFLKYIEMRYNLLESLQSNTKCCCSDCKFIHVTNQPISHNFSYVIFNELGRCNSKCIYCNFQERLGRDTSTDADIVELQHIIERHGYWSEDCIVELCNGEITIHPDKKNIYRALENCKVMFLTNAIIYDEEIERRMKEGTASLNVSIDAGTRETFHEIKGIDAFDRVVNNLSMYSHQRRGIFNLKYILLPGINDNDKDIDGFVMLCKRLDVSMAHISCNLCLNFEDYYNEKMINAIKRLVNSLKKENIEYEIYSEGIIERLLKSEGQDE